MVTLTAYYTANVKEPPWIVVVNATIMQSWESEAGGYIVGGAFGKAIAKHDISCHFPGMVRAYYVADHDTIYRHIKPGDYWTWDGKWKLHVMEDRCFYPDSTAYYGYPNVYAVHASCWGGMCS